MVRSICYNNCSVSVSLKAVFQHADFSAYADFFADADFSAYLQKNFHHNAHCWIKRFLFYKDLDKIKIANTSNIRFLLMACKTSLFLLNKINYFYVHWFIAEKCVWSNKGKERCDFELVSSKSSSSQFWFSFMWCCCWCWFICCCCCCCCYCCSSCSCCSCYW